MTDLTYSPLQEQAIAAIVAWFCDPNAPQEFYLAGFAGTGKTTVVSEAIRRIKDAHGDNLNVVTGAYTGKAAHVLRKKGNPNAQTIHSMIYKVAEDEKTGQLICTLNMFGAAAMARLIILDECSMINLQMADDLRSFGVKILVMGDPGQLPPIEGEGSFTARNPDFFLHEIHRQAADSPIIELATWARQGIMPPVGYSKDGVHVLDLTVETEELLHNQDTQVLCGLNRIRWAVTQLMRERLGYYERMPMVGERILCCKNNNKRGLFNGGAGTLRELEIRESGNWNITADIEGVLQPSLLTDPYLFRRHFDNGASTKNIKNKCPNEFDWAYAWSVHKGQGSSWPHVTLIDNSRSFREHRWKHLYTGITRAESGLTVLI